jgi:CRP-like cAMP-binding protein
MTAADGTAENRLLAALPSEVLLRWQPQLQLVELAPRQVLYEPHCSPSHVHFPSSAICSLTYVTDSGASAEMAVVGNEGIVGIAVFMGGNTTPSRAVVQSAGQSLRMQAAVIRAEFERSPPVMHLLLRYTQTLITQLAQTAVCNRHHTLEHQLCRWLLMRLDRLQGNEVRATQEMMAHMLGVRREGVTEAALHLQAAGLVHYARGRITVLDRPGLERRSCECYAVVRKESLRLLPAQTAS